MAGIFFVKCKKLVDMNVSAGYKNGMKRTWKAYAELKRLETRMSRWNDIMPERDKRFFIVHEAIKRATGPYATGRSAMAEMRRAHRAVDEMEAAQDAAHAALAKRVESGDKVAQAAAARMSDFGRYWLVCDRFGSIYFYLPGGRKVRFSDHPADAGWAAHGMNGCGYRLPDEDNVIS